MKKLIFLLTFISITSFAQQAKQSPLVAQAYEIANRVEKLGNSNTNESIQQGVNEIEGIMTQATDKKDIEDITYLRGMTYFSYVRFMLVGKEPDKPTLINIFKKVISDLEFVEKNSYEDDDSVYLALKKTRLRLEYLQNN